MFILLRTLLCCVINGLSKISKVYFYLLLQKEQFVEHWYENNMYFYIVSPKAELLFL